MPRERAMQCLIRIMAILVAAISLYCGSIADTNIQALSFGIAGGVSAVIIWGLSR